MMNKLRGMSKSLPRKPTTVAVAVLVLLLIPATAAYFMAVAPEILSKTSSGNIYLSPANPKVAKGEKLQLNLRISPGTPVDTVVASISFDSHQLKYDAVSYDGSAFTTQIPANVTDGKVSIQTAKFGGERVVGDSLVATVTFIALDTVTPKLTLDGNAASIGIATYPTIMGQPSSAYNQKIASQVNSSSTQPSGTKSSFVDKLNPFHVAQKLFETMGLSPAKASALSRAFIWTLGMALVGVLIGVSVVKGKHLPFLPHKVKKKEEIEHEKV